MDNQTGNDSGSVIGTAEGGDVLAFGPFELWVAERRLERDGSPAPIGDKAFDILRTLVEHPAEVVDKRELMRCAAIISDESLRFHIAGLRRTLGDGRYVANVAGRGYSFTVPVSRSTGRRPARPAATGAPGLPPRPRKLIGRGEALSALAEQLQEKRFVTVVGPGGVGKTSIALTLAHDLASQFDGDVCFFDVSAVFNPELLEGALASALGLRTSPIGPSPSIVSFLEGRRMLLILDGCEPNVHAAAELAERLFLGAPRVHVLTTSREALRADGEHVHRLFPLHLPAPGEGQTAIAALNFAAVELFVERGGNSLQGFSLTDEEAPFVSEICRKLDGLALAIELAAGRVGAYGVRELAQQIESHFALMWPGRRTAVARHQTMSATLDWSHQLLTEREQIAFRRLSVFAGAFNVDMAAAVVADASLTQSEATELLASLVSKSLVQFRVEGAHGSYRVLDLTRSYALDRLVEAGEARALGARRPAGAAPGRGDRSDPRREPGQPPRQSSRRR